ncbi:MAG: hypothetical protein ACI4LR_01795 [Treponema sp.]
MIKVQIAVYHICSNAIEKAPEHTDDASVLDMITFKTAHKSVHISSSFSIEL